MFTDIWRTHQLFGLIFCCLVFCFHIRKSYGNWFALTLCYCMISAAWLFQNPDEVWPGLMIRIDGSAANAMVFLTIITAVVASMRVNQILNLMKIICLIIQLNCVWVILEGHGIFHSRSMDNAVAMLMLPYSFSVSPWLAILPVVALLVKKGVTAWAMAFAMATWIVWKVRNKWAILALICAVLAAMLVLDYCTEEQPLHKHKDYIDIITTYRLQNWIVFMDWWKYNANPFLGTGTGSFQWLGPAITNRRNNIFIWMHNEYLQALFEQGIIGFGLIVITTIDLIKRSSGWLRIQVYTLCILSFSQFPFRFFITQILIVMMVRLAKEKGPFGPIGSS